MVSSGGRYLQAVGLAGVLALMSADALACDFSRPYTMEDRIRHQKWLAEKKAVHVLGQFIQVDEQDDAHYSRCAMVRPIYLFSIETGELQSYPPHDDMKDMKMCFSWGDGGNCGINPSAGEIWDIHALVEKDGSYSPLLLGDTVVRFTVEQIQQLAKQVAVTPGEKAKQ